MIASAGNRMNNDPLYTFIRYRPLAWCVLIIALLLLYWQGDGGMAW